MTTSHHILNHEHVLIPFEPAALPAGPWLIFAPHADDETFGMGGSLLKAHTAGIETHVIVLTDGAMGGDAENLVEIRQREVGEATRILGVSSLQCWSEPDRGLAVTPPLLAKIHENFAQLKPQSVFFPGPMEIHPDHRAAALVVWAALQTAESMLGPFTAYSYEISVQNPANMLIDISSCVADKARAMDVYASQNGLNSYPNLVTALDVARTFSLPEHVTHAEAFYRYQAEDLARSLADILDAQIKAYLTTTTS